jgi:hypothetical protein
MELTQLVEEASRPLREEVARLRLLLAHVGDSLERTEAYSSSGKELTTMQASLPLGSVEQMSSVVEEEDIYGCFSPRGSPCQSLLPVVSAASESEGIDGILVPMLQTTPDLGFEKSDVIDAAVSLSPESGKHVVPSGDVPGAVVAREVCDFLATLVAAYPGSAVD